MKLTDLYTKTYNNLIVKKETETIEKLKKGKLRNLDFTYLHNQITKEFQNEYKKFLSDNHLKSALNSFKDSFSIYGGSYDDKLKSILENEVDKIHKEFCNDKDLSTFVEMISKAEALNDSKIYFSNNSLTISFMYELEDYKYFKINSLIDQEVVIKLRSKLYPENNNASTKRKTKDWSKDIEQTNRYLNTFNDKEKKVLLKAFYKFLERNFKSKIYNDFRDVIPATEFTKIILIISKLEEPEVFYKSSSQSASTKKISEDYTRPEIEILHGLKDRLADQKMTKTKDYIAGLVAKR